jgi:hypothetical protein
MHVKVKGPGQYIFACPDEGSWAMYSRVKVNGPGQCLCSPGEGSWAMYVFTCPSEGSWAIYSRVQVKGSRQCIHVSR